MISRTRIAALLSALTAAATIGLSAPATAADVNMWDGNWHDSFALYAWLPSFKGTVNIPLGPGALPGGGGNLNGSAQVSADDYLKSLQFAAMVAGQARKGNFSIFADIDYVDFASLKSNIRHVTTPGGDVPITVNQDTNLGLKAALVTVDATYTVDRTRLGNFDVLAGVRYAGIRSSVDWNLSGPAGVISPSGSGSTTINIWDGVVGFSGAVSLDQDGKWFIPYYADIGGGNYSNWTWQAWGALGYRFDWGNVLAGYKNLSYNTTGGQKLENLSMGGPFIGLVWNW